MDSLFTPTRSETYSLTSKYRPLTVSGFIGLDKPRKIAASIIAEKPANGGFFFIGDPGLGKTTLAQAIAAEMPAQLHHIGSQDCNVERLRRVVSDCWYIPEIGCARHLVLIDEADRMSQAAQDYMLSILDSTAPPPDTIFILTANQIDNLHTRLTSRCEKVMFSAHGKAPETAALLERVWKEEAPPTAAAPNFARIVKEACNNVRECLMQLQSEIRLAR